MFIVEIIKKKLVDFEVFTIFNLMSLGKNKTKQKNNNLNIKPKQ